MIEWTECKLGEILLNDFDGAWGKEAENGNGVSVLRSTDMRGGKLSFHNSARREIAPQVIKKKRLVDGDIIVNKSSGSAHLVGASVIFYEPDDKYYLCSNFTRCLRPDQTRVIPELLYFGLQSPQFRSQVFGAQRTTSGLRNLKISEFKAGTIPIPESLAEQRRIVVRIKECMERVEEIEGLREYQKYNITLLQDAILDSMYNDEWPIRLLSDLLVDIRNGWSGKQPPTAPEVGVLRLSCVHSKRIDLQDIKVTRIAPEVAVRFHLKKGDVFIVRGNGSQSLVGRSAISDKDSTSVIFNDLLIRLRFSADVMPSFVNYLFHTKKIRKQIIDAAKTAAGIWKINQKSLSRLQFPCPSIDVQSAFVYEASTALEYCSQLVQKVEISAIHHLRESILRKAFAGEL